jgi:beta-glucosidase
MLCVLLVVLAVMLTVAHAAAVSVDELLASMTLEAKVGQMTQIDISYFMSKTKPLEVNMTLLKDYIQRYEIGSILNSPFSGGPVDGVTGYTAQEWRTVINAMTEYSATLTSSKIPIMYGIDSIHGATYVKDAVLFPQAINIAATFDTNISYVAGKTTSKDTRAAGIPWIFSPVLGLGLQPLWARFPETFGEDPYLAATMGAKIIEGLQYDWNQEYPSSDTTSGLPRRTAACMKHFIAYSMPEDGHDRSPVQMPDRYLRELYIPAFQAAVDAGVMTAMESYQEVGGVPMVSSNDYLNTLIRKEMNFTGFMVTDYAEIENLHTWHLVSDTVRNAVYLAMKDTTIDMSMVPLDTTFYDIMLQLVKSGIIPESRVDDSVRRILQVKQQLGMLDQPIVPIDDPITDMVGLASDREASLNAARESITLVKNKEATLPISSYSRVLLTGPTANSSISQTGGWSLHWQGIYYDWEDARHRSTVWEAFMTGNYVATSNFTYYPGVDIDDMDLTRIDTTLVEGYVANSDVVVVCLGEGSYAEKPGDINDLALPTGQIAYVEYLASLGKPIVLVMIQGRPRLIHDAVTSSKAVLLAYQPGPYGGQAIAEILTGHTVPSGRLPFSYPRYQATMIYPYHHKYSDQCVVPTGYHSTKYITCPTEFAFGDGLSFTKFKYGGLQMSKMILDGTKAGGDSMFVTVDVTNSGKVAARHVVMLFLYDLYRRVTPEYKLLRKYESIYLKAGETQTVVFTLSTPVDFQYVGVDSHYLLEGGNYMIGLHPSVDCRAPPDLWRINTSDTSSGSSSMCSLITLDVNPAQYHPVCDRGCQLWTQSAGICGQRVSNYDSCMSTCIAQDWQWDYVDCITNYYQDSSCTSISGLQCYDAFGMTAPIGSDDSCDNMVTEGYLIFYAGITGATGVLFGAIIFYLAIVAGACGAGGISSRFQKPLVKYGYLKEFVGSSADDVANPLPNVAATDEDRA